MPLSEGSQPTVSLVITLKTLYVIVLYVAYVTRQFKNGCLLRPTVAGDGLSLFGRNWLKYIRLDWNRITTIRAKSSGLDALLQKHDLLFKEEVGTVKPQKATLHVKPDAIPRFFKPRPVPFAIKDAIGQELDRLEKQGIIRKVDSSDDENTVVVPELPTLSDDETELLQALTNLVAEATPEDTWRSKYTVARTFLQSSSSQ